MSRIVRVSTIAALLVMVGCATLPGRDPLCPAIDSRYMWWSARVGYAGQAKAEHWTLEEVCAAYFTGLRQGSPPFYLADEDSPTRWCLCPASGG